MGVIPIDETLDRSDGIAVDIESTPNGQIDIDIRRGSVDIRILTEVKL